jgi:hypothetical protein
MTDAPSPYEPSRLPPSINNAKGIATWRAFAPVFMLILGFGCVGASILFIMARPAYDRTILARITPGMAKPQVSKLMGPPHHIANAYEWEYSRSGNAGWVEIWFDEQGLVTSINDESVFRP